MKGPPGLIDDATGGTFRPLPAGFAAPSSGVQLAPPRVVQLGHPTNDGGDDTAAGGPLVEKGVVVDPIDGPADTVQLGSVPPAHYGPGPEFGPDGPNTELGPYAGPSTGPISLTP